MFRLKWIATVDTNIRTPVRADISQWPTMMSQQWYQITTILMGVVTIMSGCGHTFYPVVRILISTNSLEFDRTVFLVPNNQYPMHKHRQWRYLRLNQEYHHRLQHQLYNKKIINNNTNIILHYLILRHCNASVVNPPQISTVINTITNVVVNINCLSSVSVFLIAKANAIAPLRPINSY